MSVGNRNHTWLSPLELRSGAPPVEDFIERPYCARWYVLRHLEPGDEVTVTVTRCPIDLTLLGYTDVRQKAHDILEQFKQSGPLDAEDMDSEDMDSEDMDSEDMDSEDMDSEDMDSEDMDSEDMDSDDMDSDDVGDYRDVYAGAQRHALRAASVTPGVADERIRMIARADGGDLYFRVSGHLGAYDNCHPFRIVATVRRQNVCKGADRTPRHSALPSSVLQGPGKALILTHTGRLHLNGPARTDFLRELRDLASEVDGAVYDLRTDVSLGRTYAAWDHSPQCIPQANAVVESIRQIIGMFAKDRPLKYVVIVGADDVIPFARIEDRAELAREWRWAGPYRANTALGAALTYGFYLSDDPYGRPDGPIDLRGKNVQPGTIAVGRLVETPHDIGEYVDWFLRRGKDGIRMRSALSAGYTFVRDLAENVANALTPAGLVVDTLAKDSWSVTELRALLPQKDVLAPQGHYSANTYLAADGRDRLRPEDLDVPGGLEGVLWTTIGCHSGHHIVDAAIRQSYSHPASWADTLIRRRATLVGGTGYQYAESVLPENSERLYTYLAQELVAQPPVYLGDALIAAKQRYLRERPTLRGMDQKIVEVATIYGLPMLRIRADECCETPEISKSNARLKPVRGMPHIHECVVRPRYDLETRTAKRTGVGGARKRPHYVAAHDAIARPLRPVLPVVHTDITRAGQIPMGVVWTGGRYDERESKIAISRPVVEMTRKRSTRYTNRVFLPSQPFRISRVGGAHSLVFTPLQIRASSRSQIGRRWHDPGFKVYYSKAADTTTLLDAPRIESPRLIADRSGMKVQIRVRHHAAIDEQVEAFVSFLQGRRLHTVKLTGGKSHGDGIAWVRTFRGRVPDEDVSVFFQAVGGNGRVRWLTNGGHLFRITAQGAATPARVNLKAPGSLGYRQRVAVEADVVTKDGTPVRGGELLFQLGRSRAWTKVRNGRAAATLTVGVRPGPSRSLLIASFLGTARAAPAAASREVSVHKAKTQMTPKDAVLQARHRKAVASLTLAGDDRALGGRAVTVSCHGHQELVYTDADGVLRLLPEDLGARPGTHVVRLSFEDDDAYRRASATVHLSIVD